MQPKSLLNNLTDSEQEFYFEVLLRGEKNGKWQIDQKVMGGGIMQRGELGFDFRIYNDSGEAKIEHKFFHSLRITHDQARLFNNFPDTKISATRLIGLKYTSTPEDIVTIIFWTPKFLKSFPRENITESITKYRKTGIEGEKIEVEEIFFRISLEGLWNCFEKSTFTKLTGNYKGETLKQLLETPNFTIAKVLRGEFGMLNAKYKRIPKILAYDIIYKKLVYLMENLGEDVNNSYPPCRPKSEWKEFDNILKAGVVAMLESTYRLAYVSDMVEYLGLYPRLKPYLKKEKGTFYIKFNGEYLSRVVSNRLVIWSGSAGFLVRVKPHPKYHDYGYGLKGQKYIPLTRLASLALDHLEMGWLHGNKPASLKKTDAISKLPFCTTYPEIAWAANKPENVIRHLYIESVRKELMKHGLASFTTAQQESDGIISSRIGRRVIVCLERRGGEYITRTGEFEIIKE